MRANGTHRAQLTDLGEFSTFPDISPDGGRVAFNASIGGGFDDISSIGIDGSGLVQLTDAPDFDDYPAWSPDGSRIVFISYRTGTGQVGSWTPIAAIRRS